MFCVNDAHIHHAWLEWTLSARSLCYFSLFIFLFSFLFFFLFFIFILDRRFCFWPDKTRKWPVGSKSTRKKVALEFKTSNVDILRLRLVAGNAWVIWGHMRYLGWSPICGSGWCLITGDAWCHTTCKHLLLKLNLNLCFSWECQAKNIHP